MSADTDATSLIQELVEKQEQQFNRLFREQEHSNSSLRDELTDMNKRLQNMEIRLVRNESVENDNITIKSKLVETSADFRTSSESGIEIEHGLLKEKHFALEMEYRVLKCQLNDPNMSLMTTRDKHFRSDKMDPPGNVQLEKKVEELERELELSRKELQQERAGLMTRPDANKDAEERLQKAEIEYSCLESTHNNLMDQYTEIFRNNTAQEKRIRDLEKELDEFKGRDRERNMREMNILESSIGNDRAFKDLQQDNQKLQTELEEERAARKGLMNKSEEKEDLLQSLLDDKTYFSSKIESQEKTISKFITELEMADAAQRRCHQLEIENSELELNYQTRLSEYNTAIEQRNEMYKHYEQQNEELSELRMNAQAYDNVIKDRDLKMKSLYDENLQLKDSVESHSVTHQFLQEEQLRNQKDSEDQQQTIRMLKTELDKKKQELSDARRELEARKNLHPSYSNPYMMPYNSSGSSGAPSGFSSQSSSSGYSYNNPDS